MDNIQQPINHGQIRANNLHLHINGNLHVNGGVISADNITIVAHSIIMNATVIPGGGANIAANHGVMMGPMHNNNLLP